MLAIVVTIQCIRKRKRSDVYKRDVNLFQGNKRFNMVVSNEPVINPEGDTEPKKVLLRRLQKFLTIIGEEHCNKHKNPLTFDL